MFIDSKSNHPLVEVKARNRLYIVLKISKETDGKYFKIVTNRPNWPTKSALKIELFSHVILIYMGSHGDKKSDIT